MKQIDELTQTAAENPKDHNARRVLSDALRSMEEYDLATAVESKKTGKNLMIALNKLAEETGMPVSFNLLWTAYFFVPRMKAPASTVPFSAPIPLPAPVTLPHGTDPAVPPYLPRQPWWAPPDRGVRWGEPNDFTWGTSNGTWEVTSSAAAQMLANLESVIDSPE